MPSSRFDPRYIGHEFDPFYVQVERGAVRLFAKSIGETDPIYFDIDAAKSAGYRTIPAPLTFAVTLIALSPEYFPAAALIGFAEENALHVGQEFTYVSTICVGDHLKVTGKIADLYEKRGGELKFVVTENEIRNGSGEIMVTARETLLLRES